MHAWTDPSRRLIRVSGEDTHDFLQGFITNDIKKLKDGAVYAAILTPQGKYLADFMLYADGADVLIDAHVDQAAGLMQRFTMYKLRAAVTLTAQDGPVTLCWGGADLPGFADPRDAALGTRLLGPMPATATPAQAEDWTALRVLHQIPEAGIELIPNDSFILEMGFERLNGVDFRKGCYVGQEVTARMKHKTELRKGLAQVTVDGTTTPGTAILMEDARPAGTLHTIAGDRGLAYLRYDRATGPMTAGDARITRA